jgi:hypothetical protein
LLEPGRLLGRTLALLATLALKLGVTQRMMLTLTGFAAAVASVLVLLAVVVFSG